MNHLMTNFIPSLCILTIAQATVYFKTEHFKTSVPVAVSALLGKSLNTQHVFNLFLYQCYTHYTPLSQDQFLPHHT